MKTSKLLLTWLVLLHACYSRFQNGRGRRIVPRLRPSSARYRKKNKTSRKNPTSDPDLLHTYNPSSWEVMAEKGQDFKLEATEPFLLSPSLCVYVYKFMSYIFVGILVESRLTLGVFLHCFPPFFFLNTKHAAHDWARHTGQEVSGIFLWCWGYRCTGATMPKFTSVVQIRTQVLSQAHEAVLWALTSLSLLCFLLFLSHQFTNSCFSDFNIFVKPVLKRE